MSCFITQGAIEAVAGGVMDLTKDTVLGDRLSQVAGGTGFDHNFCMGQSGAMKHVARWCNSNNMSLNVSKTKLMLSHLDTNSRFVQIVIMI